MQASASAFTIALWAAPLKHEKTASSRPAPYDPQQDYPQRNYMSEKLRFAIFGTGFWSRFQIPGWLEGGGVEPVAAYNRTLQKAEKVAEQFGIPRVYDDPQALLDSEDLDFIDIITDVDTHLPFVEMAAKRGLDAVCQKPMAASYQDARKMLRVAEEAGIKLFINENFRWQAPLRAAKEALDSGIIGEPFKARATFCSAFPVFDNQPFLKELDRFILTDIGSHILDICRFLMGEAKNLRCLTKRVNPEIKGEDVANVLMEMESGAHCFAEMSYASIREREMFPQTHLLIEGSLGSLSLGHDFELAVTTRSGTTREVVKPRLYPWVDPDYAVIHSSIVDTQRDIENGLRGGPAETTGRDNFETVKLVWASYASAESKQLIDLAQFDPA